MKKTKNNAFLSTTLIIVLSVSAFILAMMFFRGMTKKNPYGIAPSTASIAGIARGRYEDLGSQNLRSKYTNNKMTKDVKAAMAVGEYYYEAIIAGAEDVAGDQEESAKHHDKMDDSAKRMGEFSDMKDRIDRLIEDTLKRAEEYNSSK